MTAHAAHGPAGIVAPRIRAGAPAPLVAQAPFWAALILLGAYLGPAEMAVKVGIVLTTLRLALLIMLAWAGAVMASRLASGRYVFVASDGLVLVLVLWMELALYATSGPQAVTSAIGLRPVEFLSAYLAGRFVFGQRAGIGPFVQVLLVVVGLLVLLGLVDLAAGENILGRLGRQYFGVDRNALYITQYRMGLPRARASFEHAILFGTFFAVCAPLLYYLSRGRLTWLAGLGLCLAGIVLALSSAPMLAFGIFAALAGFDRLLGRAPWRWAALLVLAVYGLAMLIAFVDDPLRTLVNLFTLDPETGVYRFLIWEWVAYNLQPTPWFGIGVRDWVRLSSMVSSVDALWLGQALHAGYVGVALLALVIAGAFFAWPGRATPPRRPDPVVGTAAKAVTIALVQMIFVSFTVHYWGTCWAFFALLIGMRAGLTEAARLDAGAQDPGVGPGVWPGSGRRGPDPFRPRPPRSGLPALPGPRPERSRREARRADA